MSISTELVEVVVTKLGSRLAADAVEGATLLEVDAATDFNDLDEGGLGRLEVADTDYVYEAVDTDANTVTLHAETPLLVDVDEGTTVTVLNAPGEPAQKWEALVLIDGGPRSVPAVIKGDWLRMFREGTSQAGMSVEIDDDGEGYTVVGTPGSPPVESGEWIDPGLPAPGVVPTEPPSEIVTLKVVGDATGLTIFAEGVTEASTSLKFYIDGTLFDTTESRVVRRELDAADVPMTDAPEGTTWSITAKPTNVVDDGAESDPVVAGLDPAMTETFIAAVIATLRLVASSVEVGSGSWTPENGIHVPLLGGTGLFHVPTNGDPIALLGVVLSVVSAVFSGDVVLKGETTLEGELTAAAGVTRPNAAPSVSANGPAPLQLEGDAADDYFAYGIYLTATHLYRPVFHSQSNTTIYEYDRTTGAETDTIPMGAFEAKSLTQVDGDWYVAGRPVGDVPGGPMEVRIYDSSWTLLDDWQYQPVGGTSARQAVIHTNGTSTTTVRITYWATVSGVDRLISQAYNAATGATSGSALTVDTPDTYGIFGAYYGAADFGSTRLVVDWDGGTLVRVYDTSGNPQETFAPISGHKGIAWDGDYFYGINSAGEVHQYSDVVGADTPSATYIRRNDTDGWETEASPAVVLARPARAWLRIDTPATDAEADAVGFFVDDHRQPDPAPGVTTLIVGLHDPGGAAAPVTNTFPNAPGVYRAYAADGTTLLVSLPTGAPGHAGHVAWDEDGNNLNDTGWQTITPAAGWGHGTEDAEYCVIDGCTYLRGELVRASGSSVTMGTLPTTPVNARPEGGLYRAMTRVNTSALAFSVGVAAAGALSISTAYTTGQTVYLDAHNFRAVG